jgi:cobalt-zinc-cadmium efflux system outer membrane protein
MIVAISAVCLPAHAEEPAPRNVPVISEADLLGKLAADPHLARIAATVENARAEAIAAGLRPNPSVSYEREAVFPDGGIATSYLRFSLPFEISGRRSARREAARAEVAAATAEGDVARFALVMHALRSFRIAAYERTHVELLRSERAALANAVEIVRKRTAAGTASGYDLQRIGLELAAYDDLIAAAEAQLASARLELGALVGMPEGVDAAGALEAPPDPAGLDALIEDAFTNRPDVRAAAARHAEAQALAREARRSWIPDLALSAGFLRQGADREAAANGYTAGLALSVPMFDHGQAEEARARARQRAADADHQVLARTVPVAIRARHQALVQTIGRARAVARDQLARLDQLLRSAETGYRDGGGNVVELVDAYTTARDARLRDLALRRDARLAEIDLWIALGRRP